MNAEKLLEQITLELQECVDRTDLTIDTCTNPADFMLFANKELAEGMLTKLTKWKQECDDAERQALEEIEDELLNQASGRFCINGNCEE